MKYQLYHVVVPVDRDIFRNIFHLALPIIFGNLSCVAIAWKVTQGDWKEIKV